MEGFKSTQKPFQLHFANATYEAVPEVKDCSLEF